MAYEYEQLANLYASTLSANYTAGSGVILVTSGTGLPTAGQFALTVLDQSSLAVKVIFRAFYLGGTAVAVTAEGSDNSAVSGDIVVGTMLTVRSLSQIFSDREIVGLLANRPSAGLIIGDKYVATDAMPDYFRWDSSGSPATTSWDAYIGAQLVVPPKIADLPTGVLGANATRIIWADQGAAGGGVSLAATNSAPTSDSLCGQFKTVSSPYTITMKFVVSAAPAGHNEWAGIGLRDSASGKMVMFGAYYNGADGNAMTALRCGNWNSATSFNGTVYLEPWYGYAARSGWLTIQINDNGTNRTFSMSADGINFVQVAQVGNTSFVTPNEAGILIAPYDQVLQISVLHLTYS